MNRSFREGEQPVPAQPHQPVPAQPHQPVPAQPHQPVPAQPHQPVPAQPHQPVPALPHQPVPALPHQPVPALPQQQQQQQDDAENDGVEYAGDWEHLPLLLLAKIFGYVVMTNAPLKQLRKISTVNHQWRDMSANSTLWTRLDLSVNGVKKEEDTLVMISQTKDLSRLQDLCLKNWRALKDFGLKVVADNSPILRQINLAGTSVTSDGIRYLSDKCPLLSDINLSSVKTDAVDGDGLRHLLRMRGDKVEHLNISFSKLKGFDLTMNLISTTCSQLQTLDLSNVHFTSDRVLLDIELTQSCCTVLRSLKLGNSAFGVASSLSGDQIVRGFPALCELDISVALSGDGLEGSGSPIVFLRLVKNADDLRSLSLRGCDKATSESLQKLSTMDLEFLDLSRSSAAKYEGIQLVLQKWHTTLRVLNLSDTQSTGLCLVTAVKALRIDPHQVRLEKLDLSGTNISLVCLQQLLDSFPRLVCLHLQGCFGLRRGMAIEYIGPEIEDLRQTVANIVAQDQI